MKIKNLIIYLLILLVLLFVLGSCATDKMAYISKNYEIYGTWVNPDYEEQNTSAKIVIHPKGIMDFYLKDTTTEPSPDGKFIITNKWFDNEGNVWYTIINYKFSTPWYWLIKITNSGKTMELSLSQFDYPKEIVAIFSPSYSVFNRE